MSAGTRFLRRCRTTSRTSATVLVPHCWAGSEVDHLALCDQLTLMSGGTYGEGMKPYGNVGDSFCGYSVRTEISAAREDATDGPIADCSSVARTPHGTCRNAG